MESISRLPFSVLKIDKCLIDHVCETRVKILVDHIIKLSKALNMRVLAEGVETTEQLDVLRKIKCDEIQGFYYARPMPEAQTQTERSLPLLLFETALKSADR